MKLAIISQVLRQWHKLPQGPALCIGVAILAFAVHQSLSPCNSCDSVLPIWILTLGGASWILVAGIGVVSPLAALGLSVVVTATHGSILTWILPACGFCWAVLVAEIVVVVIIARSGQCRSNLKRTCVVCGLCVIAGSATSRAVLWMTWGGIESKTIMGAQQGNSRAYVIMRRDCARCEMVERRIHEVINDSGFAEVTIVDERSPKGVDLSRKYELRAYPAFVGVRNDGSIVAQSGGGVDQFIEAVKGPK